MGPNKPRIELGHVIEQLTEQNEKRRQEFENPQHSLKFLTERLGVTSTTVRNWMTRRVFPTLDAEKKRGERGWRLFSTRDVIAIAAAHELSRIGVPPAAFPMVVRLVLESADNFIHHNQVYMRAGTIPKSEFLVIYPDGDNWSAERFFDFEPNDFNNERPGEAYAILEVSRFLQRTLEVLGFTVFAGTARRL